MSKFIPNGSQIVPGDGMTTIFTLPLFSREAVICLLFPVAIILNTILKGKHDKKRKTKEDLKLRKV